MFWGQGGSDGEIDGAHSLAKWRIETGAAMLKLLGVYEDKDLTRQC